MHEIPRQVLLQLPRVFGVDLSITNEVLLLWASALVTCAVLILALSRRGEVARGPFQNAMEGLMEFVETSVVKDSIGTEGAFWSPLLLTLFFFILFMNLLGMLPFPDHVQAMTSNINVTLALALMVFFLTIGISMRKHGFLGFLKRFVPAGLSPWVTVMVIPVEVISWLARPFSLAVRLFANMLAGHSLILVFLGLTASVAWFAKPFPLAGAVVMSVFELFVCFIQAFVFTLLAGMYIKDALEEHG